MLIEAPLREDGRATRRLLTGSIGKQASRRASGISLRRGEAQRDHGARRDGEPVARAAPLLRLAANGQAVAATSRHLGQAEGAAMSRRLRPRA